MYVFKLALESQRAVLMMTTMMTMLVLMQEVGFSYTGPVFYASSEGLLMEAMSQARLP